VGKEQQWPVARLAGSALAVVGILGLCGGLLAGCASANKGANLLPVWPLPPEPPRIKYVGSISSQMDVEKVTFFGEIKELIFGAEPRAKMGKPYGVAVDSTGRLLVADSAWGKVMVFDRAKGEFSLLGLSGPGVLSKPLGVTADSQGRIYVTDSYQNRAVVYDHDGKFLLGIGERGRFEQPIGIAVNEKLGRIYIVDTKKNNISVFDTEGNFLFDFGGRGADDGQFNFPTNLAVSRVSGTVAVMDSFNFRVQLFDADGKFIRKFGGVGTALGHFSKPKGIGFDSDDHIYVVDAAFNNVQIFSLEGQLLLFFGRMGTGPGEFWLPAGLAIDGKNQIYVADQYNKKVHIFQYIEQADAAAPPPPPPAVQPAVPPAELKPAPDGPQSGLRGFDNEPDWATLFTGKKCWTWFGGCATLPAQVNKGPWIVVQGG